MQDFAWRRVRGRIERGRLDRGEALEHGEGDSSVEPQTLQRGDQPIPAEGRGVPGNAGIGVKALRRLSEQHRQVDGGAAEHLVEAMIGGVDFGVGIQQLLHFAVGAPHHFHERHRLGRGRVAAHRCVERNRLLRLQIEPERRRERIERIRSGIEQDLGLSRDLVETQIAEGHCVATDAGIHRAAPLARRAANLKYVGEIAAEGEGEGQTKPLGAIVPHRKTVMEGAAEHEDRARNVQQVLLQDEPVASEDVGIGEIYCQHAIVVGEIGAQQQRLQSVDAQLEMRKIAGVEMKQAVRAPRHGVDIAMVIEDQKAVALLHGVPWASRRGRRRNLKRQVGDAFGSGFVGRQGASRHAVRRQ